MKFVNLTPHEVRVADQDGTVFLTIPPSGQVARVATTSVMVGEVDGIPIYRTALGDVTGLPEPQEGVTYVVSTLVAQVVSRPDVVAPDTGPTAIRENGQVVAIRRFQVF
ncbi:MAG: hypothetical protein KatS3mg082_1766 [Nitrospiraceae bacterium]|nr:MAG: hypothetical protein KatS3mg082_1766 [Nitrospiraceae bacterium]